MISRSTVLTLLLALNIVNCATSFWGTISFFKQFEDNNFQEGAGDEVVGVDVIPDALKQPNNKKGSVTPVVKSVTRIRRKAEDASTTTEATRMPLSQSAAGPILYSAVSQINEKLVAMIYSSKPPLLKINDTSINLGEAILGAMDIRDPYTRLVVAMPFLIMRFKFVWLNGYWHLQSLEIAFVDTEPKTYELVVNQNVRAPRRFSYYCGSDITFTNKASGIELRLFEVQVQPDAESHTFDEPYNCVEQNR